MRYSVLTTTSLWRTLFVLLILYACSEPEINREPQDPVIPEEPGPPPTQPTELCSPHVIDGYCNKISFNYSEEVKVYLQSQSNQTLCALTIYGLENDSIFSVASPLTIQQPVNSEPSKEGFNYQMTVTFKVPSDLPSGIYLIENKVPFIVKPKGHVDVLVVYPSNTANAYAESGGKSLYGANRASAVSFHRPIPLQDFAFNCLTYFSKKTNWEIGFIADEDMDDYETMNSAEILAIVGHNEYWTRKARTNFDAFVNSGGDALILSGNTMWWQVRYSNDADKSQMICYKDMNTDPIGDPLMKTFLWNDPILAYPILGSIGADFDNGGYGRKMDNGWDGYKIVNPHSPLLEGLGLNTGDIIRCPTVEYDGAPIKSLDINGYPVLDFDALGAYKAELIGFDKGYRVKETFGTFIVLQRNPSSGYIINTGSTDWCTSLNGVSATSISAITDNSVRLLLEKRSVFSF
jgi:hypothetical protein